MENEKLQIVSSDCLYRNALIYSSPYFILIVCSKRHIISPSRTLKEA